MWINFFIFFRNILFKLIYKFNTFNLIDKIKKCYIINLKIFGIFLDLNKKSMAPEPPIRGVTICIGNVD